MNSLHLKLKSFSWKSTTMSLMNVISEWPLKHYIFLASLQIRNSSFIHLIFLCQFFMPFFSFHLSIVTKSLAGWRSFFCGFKLFLCSTKKILFWLSSRVRSVDVKPLTFIFFPYNIKTSFLNSVKRAQPTKTYHLIRL